MKLWSCALLLLTLAGCGEPEAVSRDRKGDTTFVYSAEPLLGTATLREVLRIGVVEGAPEYMFARPAGLTVGPTGDVFVVELEGEIRHYDPEGKFVRRVARRGRGPGEVEYVMGMDVAEDGRLALVDLGNQRVGIYSADGEFIRQIHRPPGRPSYGRSAIHWDESGEIWISLNPPRAGPDTLRAGDRRPIYGRLASDGTVVDTVFLPRRATEGCWRRHHSRARGGWEDDLLPYLPFPQWTRSPDGTLVFGCPARYAFDVARPDGSVVRSSRRWKPVEMEGAEHAFWLEWFDEVARERPAYVRLWVSEGGRVWAWPGTAGHQRETSAEEREFGGMGPVAWDIWSPTDGLDVFDAEGRWLGHVSHARHVGSGTISWDS